MELQEIYAIVMKVDVLDATTVKARVLDFIHVYACTLRKMHYSKLVEIVYTRPLNLEGFCIATHVHV